MVSLFVNRYLVVSVLIILVSHFSEVLAKDALKQTLISHEDLKLSVGMSQSDSQQTLKALGWEKQEPIIIINNTTLLWTYEPCRAASIELTDVYEKQSMTRPPKNLKLTLNFYECVNDEVEKLGQLSKIEVTEQK